MSPAIHIELDALCLLLLCTITYQSHKSVNQQKDRILFRTTSYGIIFLLVLDILWVLIEGRIFPGAIPLNLIINALYLGVGVLIGCLWYLYVLETMGYQVTKGIQALVLSPGVFFIILNLISIRTGWIFTVSPENIYLHSSYYWVQFIGAYGTMLFSFVHILIKLIRHDNRIPYRDINKLLKFYLIPVIGSIVSLFQTGMPGTWTCAAISVVLIYMGEQDREILSGMITAMAADYRSIYYANLDENECVCVRTSGNASADKPREGQEFPFLEGFTRYAEHYVVEADKEAFLQFIKPENICAGLAKEAMISLRYLTDKDGVEEYEMLRIAGVRTIEDREDHIVHAIGVGFSNVDRQTREAMEQNRALSDALLKAEEANAAKTSFLSSMSHEIRTPMNAIIGLDNIALREPNLTQHTRDELEKIGSSARHLLSLINDILDMSRIESGRMELKKEEFFFREMLEQINIIVCGQCEDKGLYFVCRQIEPLDEYFIGDDLRLKQVIINILGNAVKFTDAPGTVTFAVEQTDVDDITKNLRFTIKDTGIGMDAAFIPKLFEPFAQEDATSTNRYGGSGLGMAITKKMVDLMGGRIEVESEKGQGTTFVLNIPLQPANHVPVSEPVDAFEMSLSLAGLHVLIAEDMELNYEIMADLLEMEEITTEWAESGKRAVEMFDQSEEGHFCAILMDMRMPVMDGLAATQEIRRLNRPDARTIPIIALTANAFEEDVRQCLQAGMNAHLSKPVDIGQLISLLGRLL
ncbi:MAG: response regulator [Blautia sp.]|nr:response regulator [Blautia sp.]